MTLFKLLIAWRPLNLTQQSLVMSLIKNYLIPLTSNSDERVLGEVLFRNLMTAIHFSEKAA
jgi:hypothetical protein